MSSKPLLSFLNTGLTQQLRHLQACCDEGLPLSYDDCIKDVNIADRLLALQQFGAEGEPNEFLKDGERIYCLEIVKNVLLTQFELLCISNELENNVENSFSECKKICQLMEHCTSLLCSHCDQQNSKSSRRPSTFKPDFCDFAKRIIQSRCKLISQAILHHPSKSTLLRLAKFESVLIRALLGIFATYTSLLHSPNTKHTPKMMYVSEEMFALAHGQEKLTWMDCLIPGAQSEGLRLAGLELTGRVWGEVARRMVEALQPVLPDDWAMTELVPLLEGLQKEEDLQPYSPVVKCLWYVTASLRQQVCLLQWDSGFQSLLVAMPVDLRRGFKSHTNEQKTTKSTSLVTHSVFIPLTDFMQSPDTFPRIEASNTPGSVAQHLDNVRLSQPIVAAMEVTLRKFSTFLSQGMKSCLVNWNLRGLGQGLFVDSPAVRKVAALGEYQLRVAAPLFVFPPAMGPHLIESTSRQRYSLLYSSFKTLQESSDELCVYMTRVWGHQCAQVLQTVFPSQKAWRNTARKSGVQQPANASSYTEVIIEQLLSPVLEACLSLPPRAQSGLAALCLSVVLLELRKVILDTERVYRPSAGRQLLTDYRHLIVWLTSNSQSLSKEASHTISSLPLINELEHGLLVVCGTAGVPQEGGVALSSLLHCTHLPLLKEMAWLNKEDWTKALAV